MWQVRYIDGTTATPHDGVWPDVRASGIDFVDLAAGDTAWRIQGKSVYWLRRQSGMLVVGGGTVVDVEEATASPDGFVHSRPEFMPDVSHVKIGWWSDGR
jgi:hypothetical protein